MGRLIGAALLIAASGLAQDLDHLEIEQLAASMRYTDGPVWSPDGYLIFSDVPSNRILVLKPPATDVERAKIGLFRKDSGGAAGNALDSQGRLYTCETHNRRVTRTDKKERVEVIADRFEGKRFNSPNDVTVRKDGQVYFTDPAFGTADDAKELDFYGVFHVSTKGVVTAVGRWKTRPNGIALSADGRMLLVSDSDLHSVHAWTLDRAGDATGERTLIQHIAGVPNGLRVDGAGRIWIAAKGLQVYSAEGKLLRNFELADTPSNLTFGGDDGQTLFVTAGPKVLRVKQE